MKTPSSASPQIKAYLDALPPDQRRALRTLQRAIRASAPDAVDGFSYGIPSRKVGGRTVVWYAAWKRHVSLYPIGAAMLRAMGRAAEGYETSKGTIRFPLDEPLPEALVKRLVKARLRELRTTETDR